MARVKLSSRDLAVLELWGPRKSKYDKPTNFGDKKKNKSIPYYTNAHVQGQVRNPTTAIFIVQTSMSTHTHSHVLIKCNVPPFGIIIAIVLTFFNHADAETLLKPAVLTSVTTSLVHWTVFICQTNIFCVFLHCSLRKGNREIVNR